MDNKEVVLFRVAEGGKPKRTGNVIATFYHANCEWAVVDWDVEMHAPEIWPMPTLEILN